jgi:hypothetical protein
MRVLRFPLNLVLLVLNVALGIVLIPFVFIAIACILIWYTLNNLLRLLLLRDIIALNDFINKDK